MANEEKVCTFCGEHLENVMDVITIRRLKSIKILSLISYIIFIVYYSLLTYSEVRYGSTFVGVLSIFAVVLSVLACFFLLGRNPYSPMKMMFSILFFIQFCDGLYFLLYLKEIFIGVSTIVISLLLLALVVLLSIRDYAHKAKKIVLLIITLLLLIVMILTALVAFGSRSGHIKTSFVDKNHYFMSLDSYGRLFHLTGICRFILGIISLIFIPISILTFKVDFDNDLYEIDIYDDEVEEIFDSSNDDYDKEDDIDTFNEASNKLLRLKELYDAGAISKEEYEEKRNKYINDL